MGSVAVAFVLSIGMAWCKISKHITLAIAKSHCTPRHKMIFNVRKTANSIDGAGTPSFSDKQLKAARAKSASDPETKPSKAEETVHDTRASTYPKEVIFAFTMGHIFASFDQDVPIEDIVSKELRHSGQLAADEAIVSQSIKNPTYTHPEMFQQEVSLIALIVDHSEESLRAELEEACDSLNVELVLEVLHKSSTFGETGSMFRSLQEVTQPTLKAKSQQELRQAINNHHVSFRNLQRHAESVDTKGLLAFLYLTGFWYLMSQVKEYKPAIEQEKMAIGHSISAISKVDIDSVRKTYIDHISNKIADPSAPQGVIRVHAPHHHEMNSAVAEQKKKSADETKSLKASLKKLKKDLRKLRASLEQVEADPVDESDKESDLESDDASSSSEDEEQASSEQAAETQREVLSLVR